MSAGKTYWWAKDAAWLDREAVVELGVRFGPAGPLVLDALCGMAKFENDAGRVFTGLLSVSRKTFTDPDLVCEIVTVAADVGALDDLEFDEDGRRFRCRVSGWQADQTKGRTAQRVAEHRAKADDQQGDEALQSVTGNASVYNSTAQHSTAQQESEDTRPVIEAVEGATNDEVCELFAFWQQATNHPQAKLTDDRRRKIRARLAEGYTAGQIRKAIEGAAIAAFVKDGVKYDDLELICRNGTKLESFIDRATATPVSPMMDRLAAQRERLAGA
ncbi:MAG: hypothetical protein WAT74_13470 [Flavobacteriales bacterium]